VIFSFLHYSDLPMAVNRGLVKNGTQCQPVKKYTAKCQITHRPDQMDEPDYLK
jgi:hypothetical protein